MPQIIAEVINILLKLSHIIVKILLITVCLVKFIREDFFLSFYLHNVKLNIRNMPEEVMNYVARYGYLAIFILVFLQETGMPNPFPNELLLILSGYLSYNGILSLPIIILTAVSADFLGTNILYFLFYKAGSHILNRKPKWIPVSAVMIENLTRKINKGGQLKIFIFRLTPFTRGYASVIAGLLQTKPKVFLPIALSSAIVWASVYVVAGNIIGPSWSIFIKHLDGFNNLLLTLPVLVLFLLLLVYFLKKRNGIILKQKSSEYEDMIY